MDADAMNCVLPVSAIDGARKGGIVVEAGGRQLPNLILCPVKPISVYSMVKTHGKAAEFQSSAILDCPADCGRISVLGL